MSLLDKASLIVTPNAVKESKLYSVVPSSGAGDMDVVRATTATRVNSAGLIESVAINIPRIDYTNGSCPSLLVEPQRTNIATYSEDFTNVTWAKVLTTITSNNANSPDGTQTADKLIPVSSGVNRWAEKSFTVSLGVSYTNSCFVKANGFNWVAIHHINGDIGAWFNLSNGTIGTINSGSTASIQSFGNGWYRCSVTKVSGGIVGYNVVQLVDSNNSTTATLNGTNGLLIWGAQTELGSYSTSYIPTVASSVTRNADVISKTGISSLIGQTEGTIFLEYFNTNGLATIPFKIVGSDGKLIWIRGTGAMFFGNSSAVLFNNYGTPTANQRYKIAFVYGQNDFRLYVNGSLVSSVTSGTFTGSFSDIQIPALPNEDPFGQQFFINSLQLYKTKLSNTELAQLTTL